MKHVKALLVGLTVVNTLLLVSLLANVSPVEAQQPSTRFPLFSSPDFVFRVNTWKVGEPISGTLLIRRDGQWHEVQADVTVAPAVGIR